MIVVALSALGFAVLGWVRATRFGGNTADKIQYAVVHATAAALVTMLIQIVAGHLGLFDALV